MITIFHLNLYYDGCSGCAQRSSKASISIEEEHEKMKVRRSGTKDSTCLPRDLCYGPTWSGDIQLKWHKTRQLERVGIRRMEMKMKWMRTKWGKWKSNKKGLTFLPPFSPFLPHLNRNPANLSPLMVKIWVFSFVVFRNKKKEKEKKKKKKKNLLDIPFPFTCSFPNV